MNADRWPFFTADEPESWIEHSYPESGDDLAATYARCFSTPDGRRVLAHLRNRTFGRVCGADASEALLRHLEGQRQLVAGIAAFIQRGTR